MTTSTVHKQKSDTAVSSKLDKCVYQIEQQVKFIHLEAEIECLLKQLQNLKKENMGA
ncbi:MAG: hypothetical protein QNJ47_20290 [Nostocaceae cyanobacterium]|nr:hypothetical protein [Nostocaceae cyanobacterium]